MKSMIGLLCMGKPDYDAIEAFREVPFFRYNLGIDQCPSSLRQRLDVVNGAFDQIVKEESARLIRNTALEIGMIFTCKGELAALDIDVNPFDNFKTKKEGVSRTYKDVDGFAPIFACAGRARVPGQCRISGEESAFSEKQDGVSEGIYPVREDDHGQGDSDPTGCGERQFG